VLDIFVDIVQTVVADAAKEEPSSHILILILSQRLLALCPTIDKNCCKMARELAFVLCDQTPA
jgi:hypothetical protein